MAIAYNDACVYRFHGLGLEVEGGLYCEEGANERGATCVSWEQRCNLGAWELL